jgi:nucleolar protein 56
MEVRYLLFESASGYGLVERKGSEEIGVQSEEAQRSMVDFGRFSQICSMKAFLPFTTAENALSNINDISEGLMTDELREFLESNLGKAAKGGKEKVKFALGVADPKVGGMIQEATGIPCAANDLVQELLRGVRQHFSKLVKGLREGDAEKAQLGLGHAYSRSKVKFDVNRADKHIIQSIALLDLLEKDINTFAMRVREWYSWHFPELSKVVTDNYLYARTAQFVQRRDSLTPERVAQLGELIVDADKAALVFEAAKTSMGMDISDIDLLNIHTFAGRVAKLAEYRKSLAEYLHSKMHACAPNLQALIGDTVGARLISHAGSLTNLSKYPASTVQILGAEKALFRALKTKGNTPKYGLIFHSSFIGRAGAKNKGRISRYLANKCSIASRIDAFSEEPVRALALTVRPTAVAAARQVVPCARLLTRAAAAYGTLARARARSLGRRATDEQVWRAAQGAGGGAAALLRHGRDTAQEPRRHEGGDGRARL